MDYKKLSWIRCHLSQVRAPWCSKPQRCGKSRNAKAHISLALLVCLTSFGCASFQQQKRQVDLGEIYDELAQRPDNERNPVIVVPGILGSRLVDDATSDIVWGKWDLVA